jgi:hypothetical protein
VWTSSKNQRGLELGIILSIENDEVPDPLSKVKTRYNAKLDEELLTSLKEKYPALFEEPKDEP